MVKTRVMIFIFYIFYYVATECTAPAGGQSLCVMRNIACIVLGGNCKGYDRVCTGQLQRKCKLG